MLVDACGPARAVERVELARASTAWKRAFGVLLAELAGRVREHRTDPDAHGWDATRRGAPKIAARRQPRWQ